MRFMLTEQKPVYRALARRVCITGAAYPSTCYLVSELLQLKQLQAESGGGINVSLHHKDSNNYGGTSHQLQLHSSISCIFID